MRECVARAIEAIMWAEHELRLPAELHKKYLATVQAAIDAMSLCEWNTAIDACIELTEETWPEAADLIDDMHKLKRGG